MTPKNRSIFSLLLPALLLLLSAGCVRDAAAPEERQPENVCFVATMEGSGGTKATIHAAGPLSAGVPLGLVAYKYSTDNADPGEWELHSSPAVVRAECDTRDDGITSRKWIPLHSQRLLWPREGYVRYFAFAPHGAEGVTVNAADHAAPTIRYDVPAPAKQIDLLVSSAASTRQWDGDPAWRSIDVPLSLTHALTGVRFRVAEGVSVTHVRISGVYSSGTLDLSAPQAWSPTTGNLGTYELAGLSLGSGLHADAQRPGFNLLDNDKVLFLLPQTLPAGAKVQATVVEGGTSKTLEDSIAGAVWQSGQMITYTVTGNKLGLKY